MHVRLMRKLRRYAASVTVVALGAAGLAAATIAASPAANAAAGCTAAYSEPSVWGTGFTASFNVTNSGTTAITGWTVVLTYAGNPQIQSGSGWNGTWSQSGETVTITNLSYNGSLATGASATGIGANFNYSGTHTPASTVTCTPAGGSTGNTVTVTNPGSQTTTVGTAVSRQIAATDSAAGQTLTFTATGLPAGLSISSSGLISGTPTAAGTSNVTVTATDGTSASGSATFSWTVNPASGNIVTVTSPGAQTATVGTAFSKQIAATDSAAGQTLTFTATGLPAGLAISSSGLISGTPTAAVNSSVTVTAKDSTNATGSATFTFTVNAASGNTITVANPGAQTGAVGTAFSKQISATDSAAGQTLTFTATGLPAGLAISSAGLISGTPAAAGTSSVTVTAKDSTNATGSATFTFTITGGQTGGHVADPFTGAKPYLNPDFVGEVNAQATADGSAAEGRVANYQTAIWLDSKASITNGNTGSGGHTSLMQQLTNAAAAGTASTPSLVEIVVYDLPGRDCAALASNGEIPATSAGLTDYETNYINPIASILAQFASSNIRVVAIIEPDSLPNAVTNTNMQTCSTAAPFYEQGITYALNQLHAIPNVYNYLDIAHSAWLGWPNNMSGTPAVYNSVVQATTAKYASIDGFISDTANYTPTQEPLLTNPTLQVGGQNVDSATFYSFNPTFDELTYDTQMYNTLVAAGFPSSKKFLIDTSRNGWGPTHPTTITSASTPDAYVAANKIDKRPFRGDWCNQNNAGIGARPTDQPLGSSSPILAYVWIKPPGESDGDYPTSTHSHGDPHCDPSLNNQTDGSGHSFNTGAIPGFDVAAGAFFPAEFQMLVNNAFPAM
jgi:cellulose 1,4-beta-cellobiosidase